MITKAVVFGVLLLLVSVGALFFERAIRNPVCPRCGSKQWYKKWVEDWRCAECGAYYDVVEETVRS